MTPESQIEALGWEVQQDNQAHPFTEFRAFFRGFSTPWQPTLEDVLKDVQKIQEKE